jgi:ubiquinone/menaquinone biosynthesis C-methylase UbiE
MPDLYSSVTSLDPAMQRRLAEVLETRGSDPQQQAIRRTFFGSVQFPAQARVVDIGCGTGVWTRTLAQLPNVAAVVGIDPAPTFIKAAIELAADCPKVSFREGDGCDLPFEDESFDAAVFDSTLCHIPSSEQALADACRVLRSGGLLLVLDGDYATTTVALGDHDPLQACAAMTMAHSVTDRWIVRRLPVLVRDAGFAIEAHGSHGYVSLDGGYMATVVERGADMLGERGIIAPELVAALKAECRRRVEAGRFFGHIAYGSVIARKI